MAEKENLILEATAFNKGRKVLTCAKAHMLSQKKNISLKEIGQICDKLSIKITDCRLGCFK